MVRRSQSAGRMIGAIAIAVAASSCATTTALPPPRNLIVHSGARLTPDPARMQEIDQWVRAEVKNIQEDPSFLIATVFQDPPVLPWEGLEIQGDTARIRVQGTVPDARTPYEIYAHLHLMERMDRIAEWLPGGDTLQGYALERAIVDRMADVWYYGRSTFDMAPYGPLDELLYAKENGYLDAFLLTARAEEFPEERAEWLDANTGALEEYRAWFRRTFETNPPGLR